MKEDEFESILGMLYGQFTLQQLSEYARTQTLEATKTAFKRRRRVE